MIVPSLLAGMKQRDPLACGWVNGFDIGVFAAIAALAGKRQVVYVISATARPRNDVFDGERIGRETRLTLAVFATIICALRHCLSLPGREARLNHTREL